MAKKNKRSEEEREESSAKNSNNGPKSRNSFTKFCAFWGITLAALLFAVNGLLQLLTKVANVNADGMNTAMTAIDFVSKLALLFAVGVPAYGYVYHKSLAWKIIYIVAVVFYACFCIYRLF